MRDDWAGQPKTGGGGSTVRHECEGAGAAPDMAAGNRMHGSGDGEHGFLLETGVQHFGRKPEDHFGESRASEGITGKENGHEG